jgi:hypothetical protein
MLWFGITIVVILFGWDVSVTRADGDSDTVKWQQIVGILTPNANVGGFIGIQGPWTAREGKAVVDLDSGDVEFRVRGLVLANQPPSIQAGTPIIGTPGLVTEVRGTLVCDGSATATPPPATSFVNTPAVPLDEEGEARFHGSIAIPSGCLQTPGRWAFLLRVATPGLPITDRWLAHGAVRKP